MLKVVLAASFPLANTGIVSTARGLLSSFGPDEVELYSDQAIEIGGVDAAPLSMLTGATGNVVVFSHLEFAGLPAILEAYKPVLVHVGDWPGNYWRSLMRAGARAKGLFGHLRFWFRLVNLPKIAPLVFVSIEDFKSAVDAGYRKSLHIPIGITVPPLTRAEAINGTEICFSGNFRYAPNRMAAEALIQRFSSDTRFKLVFVGYHASDLTALSSDIEAVENVESVIRFLAERRAIYVSLLTVGAGSKNKILEAAAAGCPIVCTAESLDASVAGLECIRQIGSVGEVVGACVEVAGELDQWQGRTDRAANVVCSTRSWSAVAAEFMRKAGIAAGQGSTADDHL